MALPAVLAPAMARAAAGSAAGGSAGSFIGGMVGSSRAVAQLGMVQGAVNQLGMVAQRASNPVGQLASAITGKLTDSATALGGMVDSAARPIASLVRVHNPAVARQFTIAMEDAYGVIGRMLVPAMNAFTGVARKVGDLMAGLEPVFRPAIAALSGLIAVVGDELVKTVKENAPAMEMFATAIGRVAQAATAAARVIGTLARVVNAIGGSRIARFLGFTGGSFDEKATSVGAAARTARFVAPKEIADDAI